MKQKVVTFFFGADRSKYDLEKEIEEYLRDGWEVRQTSTAFVERASVGRSIAVTMLFVKVE